MSPESHLARAVFAQAVSDMAVSEDPGASHEPFAAGEARAWLFADDDIETGQWRGSLAELADINLHALRDAVDDAPLPMLRRVARLLDKGGRW